MYVVGKNIYLISIARYTTTMSTTNQYLHLRGLLPSKPPPWRHRHRPCYLLYLLPFLTHLLSFRSVHHAQPTPLNTTPPSNTTPMSCSHFPPVLSLIHAYKHVIKSTPFNYPSFPSTPLSRDPFTPKRPFTYHNFHHPRHPLSSPSLIQNPPHTSHIPIPTLTSSGKPHASELTCEPLVRPKLIFHITPKLILRTLNLRRHL